MRWLRSLAAFAALSVALLVGAEDADARFAAGLSFGRTATRAFALSPAASAPVIMAALDHTAAGQQNGSLSGLFNRPGLLGGFAAGFLGAGLLGLFFGHGLFGGIGGVASVLGLIFQIALVVLLCRLIWTWWTGRNLPAFAGLSPRQLADPYLRSRNDLLPGMGILSSEDMSLNENLAAAGSDAAGSVAVKSATAEQASARCGEG
jgi:hypothetical protein